MVKAVEALSVIYGIFASEAFLSFYIRESPFGIDFLDDEGDIMIWFLELLFFLVGVFEGLW